LNVAAVVEGGGSKGYYVSYYDGSQLISADFYIIFSY